MKMVSFVGESLVSEEVYERKREEKTEISSMKNANIRIITVTPVF
jgi:hypothetical protein